MSPLQQAAEYLGCSEIQVFKLARQSRPEEPQNYMGEFRNYVRTNRVPLFVIEYCISLNKQSKLPKV
jgi:hypothetical protein